MLVVRGALTVAAQFASAAPERQGGVFVVRTTGASVQIDPQLSYITTAWWLEYATAAKLYNYPDKRGPAGSILRREVASSSSSIPRGRTSSAPRTSTTGRELT